LQRLVYSFHLSCFKFNVKLPIHKTTIRKEPIRCKLEIDGRMVEHDMEFNYLGVNINSSRNLVKQIETQAQKAARVAGCLILSGETNI
jgi:hypothetical protein